ncbi:ATP-binding protein [Kribbella amoyensis]|uniref:ATP-binding protein n=1 Tax=Kribbella amoyensis TaxID=996641 RepID=UPI0011A5F029|nr:ATP-binding protein [Kribbella amoyensis]
MTVDVLSHIPLQRFSKSGAKLVPADIWHDLVHEFATIQALTAAALLMPEGKSQHRLIRLIEAETVQISDLLSSLGAQPAEPEPARAVAPKPRPSVVAEPAPVVPLEHADVVEVVRDVVEPLEPTTPIVLEFHARRRPATAAGGYRVGMSRVALRRVVRNLVGNALRAAPDGRVEVRVGPGTDPTGVAIEVADSGPGFGQAPRGLAGHGLSIVAGLTSAAGGDLEIGRSDLGGARVTVTLPLTRAG